VITVIGEVLADLIVSSDWSTAAAPGGAPANVAVALARLGQPVSLRSRISSRGFGPMLRAHLASNGVSLRDVATAEEPATLAVATLDAEGQASYSFYLTGTADWQWQEADLAEPLAADVAALYLGSLACALPPGSARIEAMAQRVHADGRAVVIYDPNLRPGMSAGRAADRERVERQLNSVHVVKASADDLEWLYPAEPVSAVARRWLQLGPGLVVVTLGAGGAYAASRHGGDVSLPALPAEVKDTIGAGDAFAGGLLDAMAREGLLEGSAINCLASLDTAVLTRLLTSAGLVAALTCERRGADPPHRAAVAERWASLQRVSALAPGKAKDNAVT